MNFPIVTKTNKLYQPEFGEKLPLFRCPAPPDADNRVRLLDGTLAYARADNALCCTVLCKSLVAMNSGDNVVRRFRADEQSSSGISAPAMPGTSIYLTSVPDEIVGYVEFDE